MAFKFGHVQQRNCADIPRCSHGPAGKTVGGKGTVRYRRPALRPNTAAHVRPCRVRFADRRCWSVVVRSCALPLRLRARGSRTWGVPRARTQGVLGGVCAREQSFSRVGLVGHFGLGCRRELMFSIRPETPTVNDAGGLGLFE